MLNQKLFCWSMIILCWWPWICVWCCWWLIILWYYWSLILCWYFGSSILAGIVVFFILIFWSSISGFFLGGGGDLFSSQFPTEISWLCRHTCGQSVHSRGQDNSRGSEAQHSHRTLSWQSSRRGEGFYFRLFPAEKFYSFTDVITVHTELLRIARVSWIFFHPALQRLIENCGTIFRLCGCDVEIPHTILYSQYGVIYYVS